MKSGVLWCASALVLSNLALSNRAVAAPPVPKRAEPAANFLVDAATEAQVWKETTPAAVSRLYPARKFRFVSEISGGFTDAKACVVTVRAMLLPVILLPVQGRKVVYAPVRSAVTFDSAPNLDRMQCQALAKEKLKEAVQSLSSSLAAAG